MKTWNTLRINTNFLWNLKITEDLAKIQNKTEFENCKLESENYCKAFLSLSLVDISTDIHCAKYFPINLNALPGQKLYKLIRRSNW